MQAIEWRKICIILGLGVSIVCFSRRRGFHVQESRENNVVPESTPYGDQA
jgi:hypothetical protein